MKKISILIVIFFIVTRSHAGENLLESDLNHDGKTNYQDLTIMASQWLTEGKPYVPVTQPFPGPGELRCQQAQRVSVPGGEWKTILNVSDGPCIVTNFWLACDFAGKRRQSPVRIYFDSHCDPDIEGWTSDIFASGPNEPANFRGQFAGVTNSDETSQSGYPGFSGYLKLLMPYYYSIRVDIQNPTASSRQCWMMLEAMPMDPNYLYAAGIKPGMYLRTFGFGQDGNKEHYSDVVLLETFKPTILAGLFQFFDNNTNAVSGKNFKFLEGDYKIYYGNSITAAYRSSGSEDFYHSSWYFQEGLFAKDDECLVLKNSNTFSLAASRFFPLNKAPAAQDGLKFTWQVGEPAMPDPKNTYTRWITWYYQ
jgi:hypothetical protein